MKPSSLVRRHLKILIFLLLLSGFFFVPKVMAQENSLCFSCHRDENLSKTDAKGNKISLFVHEKSYKNSVHGKLSCSGCHTQLKDESHALGGFRYKKVDCASCHLKSNQEYQKSVHAKAVKKGMKSAPNCSDCHGQHYILSSSNERSLTYSANLEKTCDKCHSNIAFIREHFGLRRSAAPGELYKESVHGKDNSMVNCTSCHGSHDLKDRLDPKSSIFRSNIPDTCGKCHQEVFQQYIGSIHGVAASKGSSDSPVCTTCHGVHGIKAKASPESTVYEKKIALTTCPQCHGEGRISKEYGLSTRVVKTYLGSFHGLSYRGGDTLVANCASCHGIHDIRPSPDPQSAINEANLQKTCGKCHPGASEKFVQGKIHLTPALKEESWGDKLVGYVKIFYIILIVSLIGGMTFFNFTDWLRKTLERKET